MRFSEAEAKKLFGDQVTDPKVKSVKLLTKPVEEPKKKKIKKYDPFDSYDEQVWSKNGGLVLQTAIKKKIVEVRYKPVALLLPGETYRIDFLLIAADKEHYFVEIKGSKKQKNYRDARSKLRAAAVLNPYWNFVEAIWRDRSNPLDWNIEFVTG